MENGTYTIKKIHGSDIGSFAVRDGVLSHRTGLAESYLEDGPVTDKTMFLLRRLHNGYVHIVLRDTTPLTDAKYPYGHAKPDGTYTVAFVDRSQGYPIHQNLGVFTVKNGVVTGINGNLQISNGEPAEAVSHRYRLPYFEVRVNEA